MTPTTDEVRSGRPGRQRSEAADEAIVGATLELIAEKGLDAVTVAAVIERAGVSSATLYRRFSNKEEMVEAAIATLVPERLDIDTGSLEGDLEALVAAVARGITNRRDDVLDAISNAVKRNDALRAVMQAKFLAPRLETVHAVLARAVERGELERAPADDVAFSLITGPLYHRGLVWNEPLSCAFRRTVVDFALRGLRDLGDANA